MRENLPVFPHRRVGFADAAAPIPAVRIYWMFSWPRWWCIEHVWWRPEWIRPDHHAWHEGKPAGFPSSPGRLRPFPLYGFSECSPGHAGGAL